MSDYHIFIRPKGQTAPPRRPRPHGRG